ncbi:uncharacterized protein J4E88_009218 [Alternaria novae-zelandiae]|uniref:uncharacterized protein n=1 Tax=Alternaria novae-zelandiae TaxID=430562 RepID=UPI0020C3B103|nr:uncharacterized protein J4E88_009218 [Alternaria novae-zelandiae]KAI4671185.1 hypothetical protein J4E88_009218 [Alternaria novae-zelandiae]
MFSFISCLTPMIIFIFSLAVVSLRDKSLFKLVKSWWQPKKTPPIVDLLTRYAPVQDAVFAQLDIADVISLSKTTKPFMGFVKLVERTQFNINDRLKHFVTSPIEFRALQARHNVLIGRNFAYEFMARKPVVKTGGKIGLYSLLVQKGPNADALRTFLEEDGYERLDTPTPKDKELSKLRVTMSRVSSDGKCSEVNIVEGEIPVLEALLPSSTSLSNLITWNRAYSVFPHETFIDKRGYLLRHPTKLTTSEWVDTESVGLDMFPLKRQDALEEKERNTLLSQRRVGDTSSWVIALNTSGLDSVPPYPNYLVESATFRLTMYGAIDRDCFSHYNVDVSIVSAPSLKHQYILPRGIACQLDIFFRNVTIVSLHRLPTAQQPQRLGQIFTGRHLNLESPRMALIEGFVPPEGSNWKYHDDEMVRYLKKEYPELEYGL